MNRSERYRRHCSIPELGEGAQGHWNKAHVAIVGIGGLGCGVATALATAGVGKLTLIDGDVVSLSNLHRQWLFDESHIGQSKVLAAQCSLEKFQPEIEIDAIQGWLTKEHLDKLKNDGVNVIVDACDQVEAKLFIDASLEGSSIPWVFGAAEQWEGRVTTLNCPDENGDKWRLTDFYDEKVKGFMLGSCQERGILGPVVQTIAMIQSIEVLRILAQLPPNYLGKMLIWDAGQGTFLSPRLKTNKR